MGTLPRPLLAALALVVVFAAAWMVVLKPHSADSSAPAPAPVAAAAAPAKTAAPVKAVKAAKPAKAVKPAASAAAPAKAAHATAPAHRAAGHAPSHVRIGRTNILVTNTAAIVADANAALRAGKVLAILFVNPAAADGRADIVNLAATHTDPRRVSEFFVRIDDVSRLSAITTAVQVTTAPTLVVIDPQHRATTVTGFADPLEYGQTIAAALDAR